MQVTVSLHQMTKLKMFFKKIIYLKQTQAYNENTDIGTEKYKLINKYVFPLEQKQKYSSY